MGCSACDTEKGKNGKGLCPKACHESLQMRQTNFDNSESAARKCKLHLKQVIFHAKTIAVDPQDYMQH